jgi:diaminohydroxyphosphoribosylaminopyrimidine deaminase/5-amino-6-(5-phosphoribosylamino)uracil reductase
MRLAVDLARTGQGAVEPNPMVGCVLVRDGQIIGQGFHRKFGGPHAEIEALRSLGSSSARGATAYVSLEPCCHHGKTPPCTEALIQAQVSRVVVAMRDPFPQVAGRGLNLLREAGIAVTTGVMEAEAAALNAPYIKLLRTGRPWVIAKWAMTVDGRIATASGQSQWISNEDSRREVHRLRSRVDAIAVGMGTVRSDNPRLTARLQTHEPRSRLATRVVFCRHELPAIHTQLVATAREAPLLLVLGSQFSPSDANALQSRGAEVLHTTSDDPLRMIAESLEFLGTRRMTNIVVEGGSRLMASFLEADQIDECQVFIGPMAFGGERAPGPIGGNGVANLDQAPRFELIAIDRLHHDVRLTYRRSSQK